MSSLIVSQDLHIMMLELSVEKLFVPDIFDKVTLRKTTLMFRILNNYWIELQPQLSNYKQYNGSNKEEENFYGGKSIVFAISEDCLKHKTKSANIKVRVFKEISEYFDIDTCYDAGVTHIDIHSLFNGIVKELSERKNMENCFTYYHEREPISRSMKGDFEISNEKNPDKLSSMNAYIRLSYFGKSIITEFDRFPVGQFHVSEEMYEGYPYQCLELSREELENGFWGGSSIDLPLNQRDAICECGKYKKSFIEIEKDEVNDVRVIGGVDRSIEQVEDMSCEMLKRLKERRRGKSDEKLENDDDDDDFDDRRGYERNWTNGDGGMKKKKRIGGLDDEKLGEKSARDVQQVLHEKLPRKSDFQKVQHEKLAKRKGDDVQYGKKKRRKSLSIEDTDSVGKGLRKEKKMRQSRYRESGLIERKKTLAISDAKRRENLKGMATGTVTTGLDESKMKRKCSNTLSIVKCPVEVIATRCCCPDYKLLNCYNYQYC